MLRVYYWSLNQATASGTPCHFNGVTGSSGNAYSQTETDNIVGAAGAVVTIQITQYTVTNSNGQIRVNGSLVFMNNTFTVTLDGSGNGSFTTTLSGDPADTGTVVRVQYTIVSVSTGQITTPNTLQASKVF